MPMNNEICRMLGVEFPILAFSHCRDVVAAVTNAGGFGVLGAVSFTAEALDLELRWIDEAVGGRPYGVDMLIPHTYVGSEQGGLDLAALAAKIPDEHRRFLDDLLVRHGVEPVGEAIEVRPAGMTTREAVDLIEVAFDHPIKLLASALGPPPPEAVERAHRHGAVVAGLAGTTRHALRQRDAGVDIVIAQGYEAGGHTGDIATMVLVPEVVDAVAPLPVLAAGGIGGGRQMAAAFALGAKGVWTGSVWLTTHEAETHPVVKQKFLAASSSDTVRSRSSTGKPARQLRTAWTEAWDDPSTTMPLPMPLHSMLVNQARRRIGQAAMGDNPGARELVNYFVGQVVGSAKEIRSAQAVVMDMIEEFIETVDQIGLNLTG